MTSPSETLHQQAGSQPLPAQFEPSVWQTRTVRRFFYATFLTLGLAALFQAISLLESNIFGEARVVDGGFGAAMQFTGIPHFIIGFLFMVTSKRMLNIRSRLHIVAALAIGSILCWFFYEAGGPKAYPRLPMAMVIAYFLVHQLRDEYFFYRLYGDGASDSDGKKPLVVPVTLIGMALGLLALLWSLQFVLPAGAGDFSLIAGLDSMDAQQRALWWLVPVAFLVAGAAACLTWSCNRAGLNCTALLAKDKPIWFVYAAIVFVIAGCALIGGKSHSIVLLHVSAWWVFATAAISSLKSAPDAQRRTLLGWMRNTQLGFQSLHIGLALLCMALAFLWAYGFDQAASNPISWIVSRDAFYYWTILHVTVSFVPKPA